MESKKRTKLILAACFTLLAIVTHAQEDSHPYYGELIGFPLDLTYTTPDSKISNGLIEYEDGQLCEYIGEELTPTSFGKFITEQITILPEDFIYLSISFYDYHFSAERKGNKYFIYRNSKNIKVTFYQLQMELIGELCYYNYNM